MLREIVSALVRHDYRLSGLESVEPLTADDADRMSRNIASYGATLIDLPEETWDSSQAQWTGSHWDAFVDLWTAEEGRSDLMLSTEVWETKVGYRFEVEMVFVP